MNDGDNVNALHCNDGDDRDDIISLLACCKINSVLAITFTFPNFLRLNIDSNDVILGVAKNA